MRTTLMLDDDLYRQVKALAATEGRTVTSIVEEAMRLLLLRHEQAASSPDEAFRIVPFTPSRDKWGILPGADLTNNATIEDLMDGL